MSDQEKLEFCGTICMAARRLRIFCEFTHSHFMWHDNGQLIAVQTQPTKQETLLLACQALVNYLTQGIQRTGSKSNPSSSSTAPAS